MTTLARALSAQPNLLTSAELPLVPAATADAAKASADAASQHVDQIVRSNASVLTGNAVLMGLVAPALVVAGGVTAAEIIANIPGGVHAMDELLFAGGVTALLGIAAYGLAMGTKEARAAIEAIKTGASGPISRLTKGLTGLVALSTTAVLAGSTAAAANLFAFPLADEAIVVTGAAVALVGARHCCGAIARATTDAIASANG